MAVRFAAATAPLAPWTIRSLLARLIKPELVNEPVTMTECGEASEAVTVTPEDNDRPAKCCVEEKVTNPPVALIASGELVAEPVSVWNVAVPAVLLNVVPADHV